MEMINKYNECWQEAMDCTSYSNHDVEYSFRVKDKTITIAFQGSTSKVDWLFNFFFLKIPYKNMKKIFFVHSGFLARWKYVRDEILEKIDKYPGYKVKLRGYSQGSTTCLLAHEDIGWHTGVRPETVLFGCPRVFGFWHSKELKKRLSDVIRIENGSDIVPSLPWFWLSFRHYGKLIHIGKKRKLFRFSIKNHLEYGETLNG